MSINHICTLCLQTPIRAHQGNKNSIPQGLNLIMQTWNLAIPGLLLGFQGIDTTSGQKGSRTGCSLSTTKFEPSLTFGIHFEWLHPSPFN